MSHDPWVCICGEELGFIGIGESYCYQVPHDCVFDKKPVKKNNMTMPYLMNCQHQCAGWCLDCVKKLKEELDSWKELAAICSETLHNPADMRPELNGTGEEGLWTIMQDVGSMLCRGPSKFCDTSKSDR